MKFLILILVGFLSGIPIARLSERMDLPWLIAFEIAIMTAMVLVTFVYCFPCWRRKSGALIIGKMNMIGFNITNRNQLTLFGNCSDSQEISVFYFGSPIRKGRKD